MAANNAHYLFYALNRDNVVVVLLELRRYNNTYQVRASVVNDGSTWSNSAWFTITDAPHKLEIHWRVSSGPGANNGGITFWVDDVQRGNFTNIDNDTLKVDYVQWGAVSGGGQRHAVDVLLRRLRFSPPELHRHAEYPWTGSGNGRADRSGTSGWGGQGARCAAAGARACPTGQRRRKWMLSSLPWSRARRSASRLS